MTIPESGSGGRSSRMKIKICGITRLEDAGLLGRLKLLHFHIGSQVTEIRKVKNAIREAARVYARLRQQGVDIRYLDVGGGLGVDYDGSRTSSDASVNYSVQEYANDVVFGVHEVCEQDGVPPPVIVSESGRMLTAYHSMLVSDVRGVISGVAPDPRPLVGDEPQVVQDLAEAYEFALPCRHGKRFAPSHESDKLYYKDIEAFCVMPQGLDSCLHTLDVPVMIRS